MKIAYICDGLDHCSDKVGCYRHGSSSLNNCCHTFNPMHAKNGVAENPEEQPERFSPFDISDKETVWWEGGINFPDA